MKAAALHSVQGPHLLFSVHKNLLKWITGGPLDWPRAHTVHSFVFSLPRPCKIIQELSPSNKDPWSLHSIFSHPNWLFTSAHPSSSPVLTHLWGQQLYTASAHRLFLSGSYSCCIAESSFVLGVGYRKRQHPPPQGTQGRIGKCTEHRSLLHIILSYTCGSESWLSIRPRWLTAPPLSPCPIEPAACSTHSPFYLEHPLWFKAQLFPPFNSSPT